MTYTPSRMEWDDGPAHTPMVEDTRPIPCSHSAGGTTTAPTCHACYLDAQSKRARQSPGWRCDLGAARRAALAAGGYEGPRPRDGDGLTERGPLATPRHVVHARLMELRRDGLTLMQCGDRLYREGLYGRNGGRLTVGELEVMAGEPLRVPDGQIVYDEAETALLERIREMRSAGVSLRMISDQLRREGVTARNGRPFAATTLLGILRRADEARAP